LSKYFSFRSAQHSTALAILTNGTARRKGSSHFLMRQTYIKKGKGTEQFAVLRIVKENAYEFGLLSGNGIVLYWKKTAMFKKQKRVGRSPV
jgi:hypothetical protein